VCDEAACDEAAGPEPLDAPAVPLAATEAPSALLAPLPALPALTCADAEPTSALLGAGVARAGVAALATVAL
jgi:hypothetical protein